MLQLLRMKTLDFLDSKEKMSTMATEEEEEAATEVAEEDIKVAEEDIKVEERRNKH